jgi:Flp pilus assembly protein TadB
MTAAAIIVIVYLLIGRPDYLPQFLDSFAGRVMLAIAVALQVIGLVWIVRLLRPRY